VSSSGSEGPSQGWVAAWERRREAANCRAGFRAGSVWVGAGCMRVRSFCHNSSPQARWRGLGSSRHAHRRARGAVGARRRAERGQRSHCCRRHESPSSCARERRHAKLERADNSRIAHLRRRGGRQRGRQKVTQGSACVPKRAQKRNGRHRLHPRTEARMSQECVTASVKASSLSLERCTRGIYCKCRALYTVPFDRGRVNRRPAFATASEFARLDSTRGAGCRKQSLSWRANANRAAQGWSREQGSTQIGDAGAS